MKADPTAALDGMLERLLEHEGGYVNDPKDPGGETRWGISKRSYPDEDIANLTLERAKAIYTQDYFLRPKFDRLEFAPALQEQLFDMGVNAGSNAAVKLLERALARPTLGFISDALIEAIKTEDPADLAVRYLHQRLEFYRRLADRRSSSRKFLKGWLNRAHHCYDQAVAAQAPAAL